MAPWGAPPTDFSQNRFLMPLGYEKTFLKKISVTLRADFEKIGLKVGSWSRRSVLQMKSPLDLKIQASEVAKYGFPGDKKKSQTL